MSQGLERLSVATSARATQIAGVHLPLTQVQQDLQLCLGAFLSCGRWWSMERLGDEGLRSIDRRIRVATVS